MAAFSFHIGLLICSRWKKHSFTLLLLLLLTWGKVFSQTHMDCDLLICLCVQISQQNMPMEREQTMRGEISCADLRSILPSESRSINSTGIEKNVRLALAKSCFSPAVQKASRWVLYSDFVCFPAGWAGDIQAQWSGIICIRDMSRILHLQYCYPVHGAQSGAHWNHWLLSTDYSKVWDRRPKYTCPKHKHHHEFTALPAV